MPYTPDDATRSTKKATTSKSKRAFAAAANDALSRGLDEGAARRIGNSAVIKSRAKSKRIATKRRRKKTAA